MAATTGRPTRQLLATTLLRIGRSLGRSPTLLVCAKGRGYGWSTRAPLQASGSASLDEWLSYGFARNYNQPPTHPYNSSTATAPLCQNFPTYAAGQCQNGISPAILILQQLQPTKTASNGMGASAQQFVWMPLNFYDAREGEPRDTRPTGDTGTYCSPNGVMNAVELDTGNLWLWLKASGPYSAGSGTLVDASRYNGYILYFADHRGMLPDPRPLTAFYNNISGMSGLTDVINSSSAVGVPDGVQEPMSYYAAATPIPYSPENVAVKPASVSLGLVDKFGYANLGAGFGIASTYMKDPYYVYGTTNNANAIQCFSGSVTTFERSCHRLHAHICRRHCGVEHGCWTTPRIATGRWWHGQRRQQLCAADEWHSQQR